MERNIELEKALSLLLNRLAPLGCEAVSLPAAAGRILAEDIYADRDFPVQSIAGVDGYAVRSADLSGAKAGRPIPLSLCAVDCIAPGEAISVKAGEALPAGCDAVLPFSGVQPESGRILALRALWPYDNFIRQGADCQAGARLLPAGKLITATAIALLTQCTYTHISVFRRPKAALIPNKADAAWCALLQARLQEVGADLTDDVTDADLLFTTAGDQLSAAEPVFFGIKAEPCEEFAFSTWQGKSLFTLSSAVADADTVFLLLLRPVLALLTGNNTLHLCSSAAMLECAFPRSSPKRRFLPATLQAGTLLLPGGQRPLSPVLLARCNCLVEIPAGSGPLDAGTTLTVWVCSAKEGPAFKRGPLFIAYSRNAFDRANESPLPQCHVPPARRSRDGQGRSPEGSPHRRK